METIHSKAGFESVATSHGQVTPWDGYRKATRGRQNDQFCCLAYTTSSELHVECLNSLDAKENARGWQLPCVCGSTHFSPDLCWRT